MICMVYRLWTTG